MAVDPDSREKAFNTTVESALMRAGFAASVAYKGRMPGSKAGDPLLELSTRDRHIEYAKMYTQLAMALQAERDYEERKITEIKEASKEVLDAAMRPDEPDGVSG